MPELSRFCQCNSKLVHVNKVIVINLGLSGVNGNVKRASDRAMKYVSIFKIEI